MGKKTKLQSDPALATSHAAGAKVLQIQVLTHVPLGAIDYALPEFWDFEAQLAKESFTHLKELHQVVEEIPISASKIRKVRDQELLKAIYSTGTDMVSHATRSVQHLAQRMARAKGATLQATTATERIKEAVALFGISNHQSHPGYQGFAEILKVRDAVEHPTETKVYQPEPSKWDEVPLAGLLSDRGLKAFELHSAWLTLIVNDWNAFRQANVQPGTLRISARGLKSMLSAKNPPKKM